MPVTSTGKLIDPEDRVVVVVTANGRSSTYIVFPDGLTGDRVLGTEIFCKNAANLEAALTQLDPRPRDAARPADGPSFLAQVYRAAIDTVQDSAVRTLDLRDGAGNLVAISVTHFAARDDDLVAHTVAELRRGGTPIHLAGLWQLSINGITHGFSPELRAKVEKALGEPLVEGVTPGIVGPWSVLVPASMAAHTQEPDAAAPHVS